MSHRRRVLPTYAILDAKGDFRVHRHLVPPPKEVWFNRGCGEVQPLQIRLYSTYRVHPRDVPSLGSRVLGCWINTERLLVKSGKAMVRQAARRRCVQVRDNDAEAAREL